MKLIVNLLTVMLVLIFSTSSFADNAELYDPIIEQDEGIVRILNLSSRSVKPKVNNKFIGTVSPSSFSDYVRVKMGNAIVLPSDKPIELQVTAGIPYTVVLHDGADDANGAIEVIKDTSIEKKGKSMIAIYNFTDSTIIDLKTEDGKTAIVASVPAGKRGYREVNAVTLNMAVYNNLDETKPLIKTGSVTLQKDRVSNVVVTQVNDNYFVNTFLSTINTRN